MARGLTGWLLAAAVLVAAVAQLGLLPPADLCFPSSLALARAQPLRLLTAFAYAGGLGAPFALRLHVLGCLSATLEFALAGPHAPDAPVYLAGLLARGAPPGSVRARLAAHVQFVLTLLAGVVLVSIAAVARPADFGAPFLMTPLLFYLAYLVSRLPPDTVRVCGNVGVPYHPGLPYLLLVVLALTGGSAAALQALSGVGAGLFVELLDVIPLSEPLADAPEAAKPPVDTPGRAQLPRFSLLSQSRRSGLTVALLALSVLLDLADIAPPPPPMSANAALYSRQATRLAEATRLPAESAAVRVFLDDLSAAVAINATQFYLQQAEGDGVVKALSAGQLLKVYQFTVKFWSERTSAVRAAGSGRSLRAKGSGNEPVSTLSDEKVAELEKILADVLSRTSFSADTSDRDVLKQLLRDMPAWQAAQMGQIPRDRLLSTVSQHRESHNVAHQALAELGDVIKRVIANPTAVEAAAKLAADADDRATKASESEAEGASEVTEEVEVDALGGVGGVQGEGDVEGGESLWAELAKHMNKTLASFSIPIDMKDSEVLTEILAGTGTDKIMPTSLMAPMLRLVLDTRTALLQSFISLTIAEVREHVLAATGEGEEAGPRGVLNETERVEVVELCVELLLHHDVEPQLNESKLVGDLVELLGLSPSSMREGSETVMQESVREWRRQKGIQDAVIAGRQIVTAEAGDSVDIAENATFVRGTASAPHELHTHVATALSGYDVPVEMSDNEVLKEYLQLLSLDMGSLSTPMHLWLQSAIVSYRHSLAQSHARQAELAAANNTDASPTNATNTTNTTADATEVLPPMLAPAIGDLSAVDLLDPAAPYPVTRAKSARHLADDFAILLGSVLQLLGATSRLAVLCAPVAREGEPGGIAPAEVAAGSALPSLRRCFAVVEARLGKSTKRLSAWVSQHRKAQKSTSKHVKGAKEVWYRRDRLGSLWLPLPYLASAKEQYPGAPYLNYSSGATFSLPLRGPAWWEVEGEAIDSRGLPKLERSPLGSLLSTM